MTDKNVGNYCEFGLVELTYGIVFLLVNQQPTGPAIDMNMNCLTSKNTIP